MFAGTAFKLCQKTVCRAIVVMTDAESPIPKIFFSTVKFACML